MIAFRFVRIVVALILAIALGTLVMVGPSWSEDKDALPAPIAGQQSAVESETTPAPAQAVPLIAEAAKASYAMGSGDRLKVTVFGEADLTGEFLVDGSGVVAFPLLGELRAAGLTQRQFEEVLTQKLGDGYLKSPRVAVEVMTYRPFYILGEVKNPGSYPYVSGMSVFNAVALAGGYSYRARTTGVYLRRAPKNDHEDEVSPDVQLMPGDVLRVPERFF